MGELEKILKRKVGTPRSLDRLDSYVTDIFPTAVTDRCCGKCYTEDDCDTCPGWFPIMQLEYDIQTQIIEFAEKLIKEATEA